MLHSPSKQLKKILDLANFLDTLEREQFDMGKWGQNSEPRCICGWLLHNEGHTDKCDWRHAGQLLGLDDNKAHDLFHSTFMGPKMAAKVLRHLAVTGELVLP